jgi:transposase
MTNHTTNCAGIDTAKRKLDVALDGRRERLQVGNTPEGHRSLSEWLQQYHVMRVGIEASGGYEQAVVAHLRRDGFVVIVFQPAQVRAYARFHLQLAKNDNIDAGLIAACTAAARKLHAPPDPRLAPFAAHLTLIEQITNDVARIRTRREACRDPRIQGLWKQEIARLKALLNAELKVLVAAIRQHPDLAQRLDLIASVDGIGLRTAVVILVRMPEIGRLSREEAAALAGLAPYDRDSGDARGARHIEGGRERLRTCLYGAGLAAAFHWNDQLKGTYKRLTAAGKPHKVALVACTRKLLIYANTVVQRGTPWVSRNAIST